MPSLLALRCVPDGRECTVCVLGVWSLDSATTDNSVNNKARLPHWQYTTPNDDHYRAGHTKTDGATLSRHAIESRLPRPHVPGRLGDHSGQTQASRRTETVPPQLSTASHTLGQGSAIRSVPSGRSYAVRTDHSVVYDDVGAVAVDGDVKAGRGTTADAAIGVQRRDDAPQDLDKRVTRLDGGHCQCQWRLRGIRCWVLLKKRRGGVQPKNRGTSMHTTPQVT